MKCSKLVSCVILLVVLTATGLQRAQGCPDNTGKQKWPELVGVPSCKASAIIEKENEHVYAVLAPVGQGGHVTPGTADLKCHRVRVSVDHTGRVASVPMVG